MYAVYVCTVGKLPTILISQQFCPLPGASVKCTKQSTALVRQWEVELVSSVSVDLSCLGCDAVLLMFQRVIVLVSSGSNHLGWLAPEDEGATVVQNIGKYLPSNAVSRPR
jgi:hypothetical protein